MTSTSSKTILTGILSLAVIASSGCTHYGPTFGVLGVPIPVSPYFQDQQEDEFKEHERYDRVPILGPITAGGPARAIDPPSDDEIVRTLDAATRSKAASRCCTKFSGTTW